MVALEAVLLEGTKSVVIAKIMYVFMRYDVCGSKFKEEYI